MKTKYKMTDDGFLVDENNKTLVLSGYNLMPYGHISLNNYTFDLIKFKELNARSDLYIDACLELVKTDIINRTLQETID